MSIDTAPDTVDDTGSQARRQGPRRARSPRSGTTTRSTRSSSTRPTSASSRSSSSAPGSPVRRRRRRSPSSATRSTRSRSTTRRGGRTRSPPRAASTRRRTTRATATRSTACSTTRSRAATSAAREANVYRLAQVSVDIIDQMVAQGVPFAREYGGLLDNRSFGGAQVSRTFYARGQTGQQLLLGAYQQLARQVGLGNVNLWNRVEMRRRRGRRRSLRRHRHPRPPDRRDRRRTPAHAVVLATGGYGNAFFLSTNAMACNTTAIWRAHRKGAVLRQPVLHADPPDVHPAGRRVPVEADADVGVAAQRRPGVGAEEPRRDAAGRPDPRARARLLPRADLPELRQPRPARHRVACRQARGRLGSRRRTAEERRVPRLRRGDRPARQGRRRGALREPVRDVRADHRREPVRRSRCGSIRPRTTRWAGCGSTTS